MTTLAMVAQAFGLILVLNGALSPKQACFTITTMPRLVIISLSVLDYQRIRFYTLILYLNYHDCNGDGGNIYPPFFGGPHNGAAPLGLYYDNDLDDITFGYSVGSKISWFLH